MSDIQVKVMPEVSGELGRRLNRAAMIKALIRLREQLENHYQRYRQNRHAGDETLFEYVLVIYDGADWHTLRFSVDDTTAVGYLFVVELR